MQFQEKYKPKHSSEIIGNIGIINDMVRPFFEGWKRDSPYCKGLILYGESGNGKHSIVDVFCKLYNYDIIKYDKNIDFSTAFFGKNLYKKLLVLVEKEKISKKELKIFEQSKNPIIFIFDEFYKIDKNLVNMKINNKQLWWVVKINKPHPKNVVGLLRKICKLENVNVSDDKLIKIANMCPSFRSCITTLQSCILGDNFDNIEITDSKESVLELVKTILKGNAKDININSKTLLKWLYINNVEPKIIMKTLEYEYWQRNVPNIPNLWKENIKIVRGNCNNIKFPTKKKKVVENKKQKLTIKPKKVEIIKQKSLEGFF